MHMFTMSKLVFTCEQVDLVRPLQQSQPRTGDGECSSLRLGADCAVSEGVSGREVHNRVAHHSRKC